ncbi:hypothetical protein C1645_849129 [Glomus cerebriforme]|uniref:Uncharacterized protein n=1 Tax=Glomus cerebriforme TaxID=658196 RepID=A0A397SY22_9GLOM|nr:hypothetical protein C1645_849129 [Glomus cerebriforme]
MGSSSLSLSLPYLCLQKIFEYALRSKSGLLFSCILVCKFWNETAIPILWRDPFYINQKATILVDVYLSNFTLEELKILNLPTNLIEDYYKRQTKYDYAKFLRRMNLTQIRTITSDWMKSKNFEDINISKDCQIFQSLCSHFIKHSKIIKYLKFEPELKPLFDFNIFNLPGAESSLSGLKGFSCYGEAYNINLYEEASKISTTIHKLKISLFYGCPLNPSTLNDLSNYIKSQRQLKEFFIENRIGCHCCSHDLSLALDLTIVFKSLNTQSTTLTHLSFISINFYNDFPLDQLSLCKNLKELNITRCWNFGEIHLIDLYSTNNMFMNLSNLQIISNSIPEELIKILLIQSGKSLKDLEFEHSSNFGMMFNEILKYCIENNPNLVNVSIYIDSKEIQYLPKFLRSSTKLCRLELWDKNVQSKGMIPVETINLDQELFEDIGDSLPISLKILFINMKWNFNIKSFEGFIKNCKAPLDVLGFELCECFDNEYFDILIKNLKRPLKNLNIRYCSAKINMEIREKNEYLINYIDSYTR